MVIQKTRVKVNKQNRQYSEIIKIPAGKFTLAGIVCVAVFYLRSAGKTMPANLRAFSTTCTTERVCPSHL